MKCLNDRGEYHNIQFEIYMCVSPPSEEIEEYTAIHVHFNLIGVDARKIGGEG